MLGQADVILGVFWAYVELLATLSQLSPTLVGTHHLLQSCELQNYDRNRTFCGHNSGGHILESFTGLQAQLLPVQPLQETWGVRDGDLELQWARLAVVDSHPLHKTRVV